MLLAKIVACKHKNDPICSIKVRRKEDTTAGAVKRDGVAGVAGFQKGLKKHCCKYSEGEDNSTNPIPHLKSFLGKCCWAAVI